MAFLHASSPISAAASECGHASGIAGTVCDANDWAARTTEGFASVFALGTPASLVLGGVVVALWALALWWVARAGRVRVGEPTWLEITPAAQPAPDAPEAMWRAVAGCLYRLRRPLAGWARGEGVVSVEWHADPAGVRAGVWVPPSVPAERLAAALRTALPGARITYTDPPVWADPCVSLVELTPARGGRWAPLIDPARAMGSRHGAGSMASAAAAGEPLRGVLTALCERRRGEQACVQLVVTADTTRIGGLAELFPAVSALGWTRGIAAGLVGTAAGAIVAVVAAVLELLLSGPTRRPSRTGGARVPMTAEQKAAEAKRAARPHLRLSVRVGATTCLDGAEAELRQRAAAAQIAAGFDLVTATPLRGRWRRGGAAVLHHRDRPTGMTATLTELAALWRLPAEPARYHITSPTAATRAPQPGQLRLNPHTGKPRAIHGQRAAQ